MSNILIVEDEDIIRTALRKLLERNEFIVQEAASVAEAKSKYQLSNYDLIISDLRLPGEPGTELIKLSDEVPVLIMTSYASLRSAVDSMRLGAVDYIAKPFDHDEMLSTVKRVIKKATQVATQKISGKPRHSFAGMIGSSPSMQQLYSRINKVAPTSASILINGETGTGKELAAKAIHSTSPRINNPMISVNCAAIPETLIESELFGHEKGAFTGASNQSEGLIAAADSGTLFLDEIGELPLEAQARLLRVLQEGEVRRIGAIEPRHVDVRLIAATHRDLQQLCRDGLFREDLYYRINVVQLTLPPLRDRGKDILNLANNLLERFCGKMHKKLLRLSPEAIQSITTYTWPGNVRELENAIQRAVILSDNEEEISHESLDIDLALVNMSNEGHSSTTGPKVHPINNSNDLLEDVSLEDYFQRFVLENQDTMNETELARKLGVSRKCLWERRQRLGIPRKKASSSN